jgi:hypothetical protein
MKTIWEQDARLELVRRINLVTAETKPVWGRMSAGRMMRHLAQGIAMANGTLAVKPKKLPVRFFPLKQLLLYVVPFAKGLPTAPELLEGDDTSVDAARADLLRGLDDFLKRANDTSFPDHAAFGRMSKRDWGVLVYRHSDHHLRQFGV